MRLKASPVLMAVIAFLVQPASAVVATLGPSSQQFSLTGIGPNQAGQGQSKMSWGSCIFDGTNTNCTLSGPYTGFAGGGLYSFLVSYPGSGAFPLIAITQGPASNQFFGQATGPFSFKITLAPTTGPAISFYSFANFTFAYASATCSGVTTCAIGQVGNTPNASISGTITGIFDPTPTITPLGVITAGNYGAFPTIAPGTWVEIYGANLATTLPQSWSGADFNGVQAPTALGGTTVTIAGKPAFVDFVSPAQVNVQVPSDVVAGTQRLVVTTAGGASLDYSVTVRALEPGLLAPAAFVLNGRQHVAAVFSGTLSFVLPVNVAGVVTARARSGDNITLYGVGFGPVTPNVPAGQIVQQTNALQSEFHVSIGGTPATVTYAGLAPGFVGLYQFNLVVPNVAASDAVPLTFTLEGVTSSQNLFIAVQN